MFLWLATTSNPFLTRLVQSDLHWGFSSENSLVISLQRTWSTWTWSWWSCSCSCSSGWSCSCSSKWQWLWWSCLCSSWSTWWSGSTEHSDPALLLLRDHLLNGSGIITIIVIIILKMMIFIIIIVIMKFRWETPSSCTSLLSQDGCRYIKVDYIQLTFVSTIHLWFDELQIWLFQVLLICCLKNLHIYCFSTKSFCIIIAKIKYIFYWILPD